MINPNEPVIIISIGCPGVAARRLFDELLSRAQKEREANQIAQDTSAAHVCVELETAEVTL